MLFVIMEQAEIIAVSDIILDAQGMFDKVIQLVQIEIAHPLAGIVSDRDILPVRDAVDDLPEQPERVNAFDLALNDIIEDVVIN